MRGHTIVYWTARGSRTQVNWYNLTKQQLIDWQTKHHELKVDKPCIMIYLLMIKHLELKN